MRRTPETEDLILRSRLDCATAHLPPGPPAQDGATAFNQWANAAPILFALDRNYEALAATDKALAIFPDSAFIHLLRAEVLYAIGSFPLGGTRTLGGSLSTSQRVHLVSAWRTSTKNKIEIMMQSRALKKAAQLSARPEPEVGAARVLFPPFGTAKGRAGCIRRGGSTRRAGSHGSLGKRFVSLECSNGSHPRL